MQDRDKYSGFQKLKKTSCPKIRYGKGGGGSGAKPAVPAPPPPAPKQASYSESTAAYKEVTKKQTGNTATIKTSAQGVPASKQKTAKKGLTPTITKTKNKTILTGYEGVSEEDQKIEKKTLLGE